MSAVGKILTPVANLFGGKPDAPAPPAPPPPVPQLNQPSAAELAAEDERRRRAGAGRASNILAGADDAGATGASAGKLLLGAGV